MTPGVFVAFITAVFSLYNPVRKFALFYNNFQQALGASSEIFKFMDLEDDVREKPRAKSLPKFSGSVRFEHVSFAYAHEGERAHTTFCTTSIWKSGAARFWRLSAPAAPAKARLFT